MNAALPVRAVITSLRPLTPVATLYSLQCEIKHSASCFLPGQFLQLSLPGVGEVPISYCGYPAGDGAIELCIRHSGHVTGALRATQAGDVLAVRGPFGNGFPLELYRGQDLLLIAGGLGIAPVRSLVLALVAERGQWGTVTMLYGVRDNRALLFVDELRETGRRGDIRIQLAVEQPDQWHETPPDCRIARLPELLEDLSINPARTFAALCGPPAVYPFLLGKLGRLGLSDDRIHVSLERRMKCGVGHCGHCAVGPYLCCCDGPVFSAARLRGIEGALA